jgi:hypothetical protein
VRAAVAGRAALAALLLLAGAPAGGEVVFDSEAVAITTAASGARAVRAADLDGDGDVDLVSASFFDDKVAWYENAAGNGSVWSARPIARDAHGASDVTPGDLDADGDLDVVFAAEGDDAVVWAENRGQARAWRTAPIARGVSGARSVAIADVDGDGDLDVLSAAGIDGAVAWHENLDGRGGRWTRHGITREAAGVREVAPVDVDGDGDPDVVVASFFGDRATWYENRAGDGTTWIARGAGGAMQGLAAVAAGDLDRDGDVDLVTGAEGDSRVAWLENRRVHRKPAFAPAVLLPAQVSATRDVVVCDLDGDGDLDVLSASYDDDRVAWYENVLGDASRWHAHTVTTGANGASSVAAADLDGDGDLDLVSAADLDNEITWYENRSGKANLWREHAVTTAVPGARAVVGADVDGDGDLDAVSASPNEDRVVWYENRKGDGQEWTEHAIALGTNGAVAVFTADLDGDGDLDVLSASSIDDRILLHSNLGRGLRWETHAISSEASGAASVFAGDIDGDGDLDVLSASDFDAKIAWYENLGGARRWRERVISTSANGASAVIAADLDGDGDLDVASASRFDDKIAWYRNSAGDGSSWREHVVSRRADNASAVIAGDVDGDGDLDLISAARGSDAVAWYENVAGDGSVMREQMIGVSADGPDGIWASDVDGDGDLDVLSASRFDDQVAWYENRTGDGKTWTARPITQRARGAAAVFAADVDGDGDLDVVSACASDDRLAWYPSRFATGPESARRLPEGAPRTR